MTGLLQRSLPYDPLTPRPLPGIAPLRIEDWLIRDEVFAGQMARREELLADRRAKVLALDESARPAAEELLDLVLRLAYPQAGSHVMRPDGVSVFIDRSDPMGTLGRLVQEDLCLLQKQCEEHVLTGAVLCFPASWLLAEKYQRPLIAIHEPVASYDGGIAKRVQRLFDGVQPERPLWRFNALWYADPELHQPRSAAARRETPEATVADYLRSERQCILRLPTTGAVVFSIHTYVLARPDVVQT
ncbi:DUF3445 domain-containing protein [Ruegeria sp. 2205SS24-7]|uniref:heme-dependent oxidative N-demethylase family protein n=1 Tax=Ruegeria discodermiae TaxID=3064389 RepID=UPI0027419F81|nr:DUF3445 domain-containing protein [Ruegeria sp. 2205SS24-7]MDP5215896.1 DUF3445 domain-containing protein [Ruegeria sp. 2205SS24-7]